MRCIGIDPALNGTGVARIDGTTARTKHGKGHDDGRLVAIYAQVAMIAQDADLAAVEGQLVHAHGAGLSGMAHGAVRLALMWAACPYLIVPPASLKVYATGKGNAGKTAMRLALPTDVEISDDNEVDAWWLRAMALDYCGERILYRDANQLRGMGGIRETEPYGKES